MIYFSSDLHCGDVEILQFEPRRQDILGKTIKDHDENLIKRFNSRVQPEDTLIILGDFSLQTRQAITECRAKIQAKTVVLVLGNHDQKSINFYQSCGFSVVCYEMVLKIAGEFVRLRHHPYRKPWYKVIFPWQYKEEDREKRPIDHGHWLLMGHIHSGSHRVSKSWHVSGRQIHIGVDMNNYFPVSIKEVESVISREKAKYENKRRRLSPCTVLKKVKRKMRLILRKHLTMI